METKVYFNIRVVEKLPVPDVKYFRRRMDFIPPTSMEVVVSIPDFSHDGERVDIEYISLIESYSLDVQSEELDVWLKEWDVNSGTHSFDVIEAFLVEGGWCHQ